MTATFEPTCVPLDRTRFLSLADAAGTTVRCQHGCLWITRDGCLQDCVLAAGQSYLVEDDTRVIVTAFEPSRVQVSRPAPMRVLTGRTAGPVGSLLQGMRVLAALLFGLLSINVSADPKAGEGKAQLCMLCHKPESAGIPLLEAQPASYLRAATTAFQKGTRRDQQMQANVARLSAQDVKDIADYFASRRPKAGFQAADADQVALGERRVGELQCAGCHQPGFSGLDLVPRLAGQSRGYLVSQLEAFAAGRRKHPAVQVPANDTGDTEAIASYLATLK
jgi:cytochrome c553